MIDDDPFITQLESDGYSDSVRPMKRLNQYLLVHPIGQGSFAKVYKGFDPIKKQNFAIKRFKLKELQCIESGLSQLEREISLMRLLKHPNVIKLYEVLFVENKENVYIVLDYADCGSLDRFIERSGFEFTDDMIRSIYYQILQALLYLHGRGIVHQDIKPSNILLTSHGAVFLSDFGVGHSFQSTEMVVGSPAYQAPEAIQDDDYDSDDLDPSKEDIWSLGISLYQTKFKHLPYDGETVFEIIRNIRLTPLHLPDDTSPLFANLLRGMLEVNPKHRMTVQDVLNHPYFLEADKLSIPRVFDTIPSCEIDPSLEIVNISAKVCEKNFTFARPIIAHQFK